MVARAPLVLIAIVAIATTVTSCKRDDKGKKSAVGELAPLKPPSSSPTTALQVAGFGDAVLSIPSGATRPTPVVVAVLGIGDTPEDQCAAWRDIVGTRAFVLCPRGQPNMVVDEPDANDPGAPSVPSMPNMPSAHPREGDDNANSDEPKELKEPKDPMPAQPPRDSGRAARQVGFYPVDVATLDREVTAGLRALKARFTTYVLDREVVYAGFSRGAFLGASLAAKHPDRFGRVILIEGGQSPWQVESASAFAKGGGKRVLFACGQPSCVDDAEAAASRLRGAKIETRVVHGVGEGHGYRKQVKEELRRSLDWVTEGDATWRELLAR